MADLVKESGTVAMQSSVLDGASPLHKNFSDKLFSWLLRRTGDCYSKNLYSNFYSVYLPGPVRFLTRSAP